MLWRLLSGAGFQRRVLVVVRAQWLRSNPCWGFVMCSCPRVIPSVLPPLQQQLDNNYNMAIYRS